MPVGGIYPSAKYDSQRLFHFLTCLREGGYWRTSGVRVNEAVFTQQLDAQLLSVLARVLLRRMKEDQRICAVKCHLGVTS